MTELQLTKACDAYLPAPDVLFNKAIEYRDVFLNQIDIEYWRSIDNIPEFFELFRKVFSLMSLCPNEQVFKQYDRILNCRVEYKWNLGTHGFLTRIEEINKEGKVYIPVNFSFLSWFKYLDEQISFYCRMDLLKIMANLQQFESKTDPEFLQKLKNGYDPQPMFENYFRRKKYGAVNKKDFDLLFDEVMNDAVNSFENLNGPAALKKLRSAFISQLKGDTEKGFLAGIFNNSVLLPGNPEMEKYAIFFDLLQYLLKDKVPSMTCFKSRDEFEDEPVSYDSDYRKYQKSIVMGVLSLR